MTSEAYHRCAQCGIEYVYQKSGHGCGRATNDATWCPDCKEAVNAALQARPRLFECRHRNIMELSERFPDLSVGTLLDWESQPAEPPPTLFGAPIRRVFAPLFNLETGDSQTIREIRGQGQYASVRFRLTTWRLCTEVIIEVPMEYNLVEQRFTGHEWPRALPRRSPQ